MIIGNDLLWNMAFYIHFGDKKIVLDGNKIPLKMDGMIFDRKFCALLYIMHREILILKESEEQCAKILNTDYLKDDINWMVDGLDIHQKSMVRLKETLYIILDLFGGDLGK